MTNRYLLTTARSPDVANACAIAEGLARAYELRLLPPLTFSCSHEHAPRTVSSGPNTLAAIVTDILGDLSRAGIERLVLVNAPSGNYVLSNAAQQANVVRPTILLFPTS